MLGKPWQNQRRCCAWSRSHDRKPSPRLQQPRKASPMFLAGCSESFIVTLLSPFPVISLDDGSRSPLSFSSTIGDVPRKLSLPETLRPCCLHTDFTLCDCIIRSSLIQPVQSPVSVPRP